MQCRNGQFCRLGALVRRNPMRHKVGHGSVRTESGLDLQFISDQLDVDVHIARIRAARVHCQRISVGALRRALLNIKVVVAQARSSRDLGTLLLQVQIGVAHRAIALFLAGMPIARDLSRQANLQCGG